MKRKLILLLFLFLSITAVSASDLNQTDAADFKIDSSEVSEILYDEESGCCSFIIQEEGNETV
ncbi:hypothetical protein [Methanobrevibacter sp.]|uniref:hypothetical protein n=1 Tax=Methanobrevibacter sp. TaxID=66852 RepID=UPI0038909E13